MVTKSPVIAPTKTAVNVSVKGSKTVIALTILSIYSSARTPNLITIPVGQVVFLDSSIASCVSFPQVIGKIFSLSFKSLCIVHGVTLNSAANSSTVKCSLLLNLATISTSRTEILSYSFKRPLFYTYITGLSLTRRCPFSNLSSKIALSPSYLAYISTIAITCGGN